jgi:agmatinase
LVVGVRGYDPSEEQYAVEKGVRFVKSYEAEDVSRLSRLMADTVGGKDLYVSVDIDVLDPAYAPGVGNPEPEGLTPSQLFDLIHLLDGRRLRGFDVVEVNPIYDNGSTASIAAKTLMELVALAEES